MELRPPRAAAPPDTLEVWAGAEAIGFARLVVAGRAARCELALAAAAPFGRDVVAGTIRALVALAGARGVDTVELDTASLLVRHEARRLGFAGGLRLPLRLSTAAGRPVDAPPPLDADVGGGVAPDEWRVAPDGWRVAPDEYGARRDVARRAAELAGALGAWGIESRPRRPPGGLGRALKRLALGVADTLDVELFWSPGRAVVMGAPDRPDLMPEAVALAADTTGAVLRRFPEQAPAVRSIRFDRSNRGLTTGHYGGTADRSGGTIHLNVTYVSADALLDDVHRRAAAAAAARGSAGSTASLAERFTYGALGPSAGPTAPYTVVETTMAHELWHQLESAFEARHYGEAIALRQGIGAALGVQTLEQAIKGNERGAPDAWRAAYARLAAEVSPYATSNATEATAEMFKLWWCRVGPPTPVVARFGELVDTLMPPPPGG